MAKSDKKEKGNIGNEKGRALDYAINSIEKQYGKGSIMKLGDAEIPKVEVISTGSLGIDIALGVGGLPKGRIIEIYGPEASGKTTLALHAVAESQKNKGTAVFIDAEHALDVHYAKRLGVDTDNLIISQPDTGEQALEIADILIRSGAVDIVVIDSVAALTPRAEIEGDMGEYQIGLQARLMSQALRKLTGTISKSNSILVFINQVRLKAIGGGYGNPETTSGGVALKFYSSVRLDIRRIMQIKEGDQNIGNRVKVKIVKNKMAPPFKDTQFDLMFGNGISKEGEILDYGVNLGIIDKSGSWYSYNEERLGQGRENAKRYFAEYPSVAREIENKIREHYNLTPLPEIEKSKIEEGDGE